MKITKEQRIQAYINKHNQQIDRKLNDIYISKPWSWKECSKCESSFKKEKLWAVRKYVCGGIDSRGFSYISYLCMDCAPTKEDAHKIWFGKDYITTDKYTWAWWDRILC